MMAGVFLVQASIGVLVISAKSYDHAKALCLASYPFLLITSVSHVQYRVIRLKRS